MNIYEEVPVMENDGFILRLIQKNDCDDLLNVYSDKMALPFFNNDNCDGDNFYYDSIDKMKEAISFWQTAYSNRWFARLSIVDKKINHVIGTVELCLRVSNDRFNNCGILRIDLRSDYEKENVLTQIINLLLPNVYDLLDCDEVITKAPIYAIDRILAISNLEFTKSKEFLCGKNGFLYDNYWTIKKNKQKRDELTNKLIQ